MGAGTHVPGQRDRGFQFGRCRAVAPVSSFSAGGIATGAAGWGAGAGGISKVTGLCRCAAVAGKEAVQNRWPEAGCIQRIQQGALHDLCGA